ncbi:MAG: type 1 glutamine amidotransferase [Deltaproteobacteria bacterium]|nr:type 1 glutamine amidotransferase [Deltaproteobacteria bacterium]
MSERLSGRQVVMIVANEFEDIELLYPLLRLSEEGAGIVVVPVQMGLHPRPSLAEKPVTGRFGHPVPIPVMPEGRRHRIGRIEELDAARIDCLLFPGGFSPDSLRRHQQTLELVRQCHREKRLLAAICHAPWILISAGVMAGKRATAFASLRDDLVNAGAEFVDAPVVRDGHVITSRMPNDLPEFCQEIITALCEKAA